MADIVRYPGPGCIVEYMEGNATQIALVTEEQSGRLRLLLPNRRETRLGINRLLPWSGPMIADTQGRDLAVKHLEEHRARREAAAQAINILEVWEMAQGEMEHASAQWFAELFISTPDADTVAAYGRALLACKTHFKFHAPDFDIYSAESVNTRLADQLAQQQREALSLHGGAFFHMLWDVHCKKRTLPLPDSTEWPAPDTLERLKTLVLDRMADPESHDDDLLWRSLVKSLPDVAHLPLNLAVAWGLVPEHHNFLLDRADYAPGDDWAQAFDDAITDICQAVESGPNPDCDLPFISIDSSTTRDVDDAFYVEALPDGGLCLHLALACPALHWPFDSPLDKAVFRRGTSIYLPEATHHMLPEILGTDLLSLTATQSRPALCIACQVDASGTLLSCTPSLQHVRLAANLTYEDCEAVLVAHADNPATAYAEQIKRGEQLATLRQHVRIAAGAVIMDRPDPKLILEAQGEGPNAPIKVRLEEVPPTPRAQLLVSEMMILASSACAQWAISHDVPLLFRTQDVVIPKEYAGIWTEPHQMARIMRALTSSSLDSHPRPHAGLGVHAYSPVTSPLRRYPDLINEAQIISFLQTGTPRWDQAGLDALITPLNTRLDAAGQVQRFRPRYWKLLYIRQQGDKQWWDAIVTEENDNFATASLPREQIFVRARRNLFGERACPGQRIQVRLGKVNPLYNEIHLLEVAEEEGGVTHG
ncbi:MAG: ribonuclease catalytic domain-containing protein [Desulfovibrionaceae bacterium]